MKVIGIHGKARSGKDELCTLLCDAFGFNRVAFADPLKEMSIKYFGLTSDQVYIKKNKKSREILQGIGNSVRGHLQQLLDLQQKAGLNSQPLIGESGYPTWAQQIAVNDFSVDKKDFAKKRLKKRTREILEGVTNMWLDNIELFEETTTKYADKSLIWVNLLQNMHNKEDTIYVIPDVRYKNEKTFLETTNNPVVRITRVDKPPVEAGADHPSEIELDNDTEWFFDVVNKHKNTWRETLYQDAINIVRKLHSQEFFSPKEIAKFKLNIHVED